MGNCQGFFSLSAETTIYCGWLLNSKSARYLPVSVELQKFRYVDAICSLSDFIETHISECKIKYQLFWFVKTGQGAKV